MREQSPKFQDNLFFHAAANVVLRCNRPFRIQTTMIETQNFIPEASVIHSLHGNDVVGLNRWNSTMGPKGEMWMPALDQETVDRYYWTDSANPIHPALFRDEEDDDDFDEEDEDWDEDEDDEDWDEDDEDWDEDDEDWDEDEDWDDEDADEDSDDEE